MNEFNLAFPSLHNPHWHLQCLFGCTCAPTIVTTDSITVPFTYLSTGSDMHVVNSGKYSVACEITACELI